MKTNKIIFGLISLFLLVGCKPISSEKPSSSVDENGSKSSFVEPSPVWKPAEHWDFTELSTDTTGEWVTIPKSGLTDSKTYWKGVDWTLRGVALRDALYTYMRRTFKQITYSEAHGALKEIDADPKNSNNVLSLYDLKSHAYAGYNGGKWNREHAYPQSKLRDANNEKHEAGANVKNVASDVANLFACDAALNTERSNNSYGEWNYDSDPELYYNFTTTNTAKEKTDSLLRRGYFSPTPLVRGEVARSQLYMLVMWKDFTGSPDSNFEISTMLKWDLEHPATLERDGQRQQGLEKYQGIRNPFIDNRNVGCYIWGDLDNHTRSICSDAGIEF